MGGKVYEIDFLFARRSSTDVAEDIIKLTVPSTEKGRDAIFWVPAKKQGILARLLDCLHWSPLSWSIHRGLRDILLAFSNATMDKFRSNFAQRLREVVEKRLDRLEARGWESDFIRDSMPDITFGSVMAGVGNSGGSVRVVTDAALLLWDGTPTGLDETTFWRDQLRSPSPPDEPLTSQMVVALTKCFVLEWSAELDYQSYHDLPAELLFG